MTRASAPAKIILFGEHAVVYGEPAIAVAADLRLTVEVEDGTGEHRVDGRPISPRRHAFLREALERYWKGGPLRIKTKSRIPSAAGLGSSAALTVASVAALARHGGEELDEEAVARRAFEAERLAQGDRGSPTDTSTVTHGRGVLVDSERHPSPLWTIERGGTVWRFHDLDVPPLTLVVGNTGSKGSTGEQVAKVARFAGRSGFAREILAELGDITRSAVGALEAQDRPLLGELMDQAHRDLTILGVSTPGLDRLVEAARPTAYGAKLTGAGGGGCMIALTDDPKATSAALQAQGASTIVAKLGAPGVEVS